MSGTMIMFFFSAMDVRSVIISSLHTLAVNHILPPLQTLHYYYYYYSIVHVVGLFSDILRPTKYEVNPRH